MKTFFMFTFLIMGTSFQANAEDITFYPFARLRFQSDAACVQAAETFNQFFPTLERVSEFIPAECASKNVCMNENSQSDNCLLGSFGQLRGGLDLERLGSAPWFYYMDFDQPEKHQVSYASFEACSEDLAAALERAKQRGTIVKDPGENQERTLEPVAAVCAWRDGVGPVYKRDPFYATVLYRVLVKASH